MQPCGGEVRRALEQPRRLPSRVHGPLEGRGEAQADQRHQGMTDWDGIDKDRTLVNAASRSMLISYQFSLREDKYYKMGLFDLSQQIIIFI